MPIDPQQQFRERYDQYVASQKILYDKVASVPAQGQRSKISRKMIIFLGVLAVAFGGGAIYAYTSYNSVPQVANTGPAVTIKTPTVTDTQIDESLKNTWGSYYDRIKDNPEYREAAKKAILLRLAAQKKGISIASVASEENNPVLAQEKVVQSLENEVVTSRTVNMVTAFISPDNKNYQKDKIQALASFKMLQEKVATGMTLVDAFNQTKKTAGFYPYFILTEGAVVQKDSRWVKPFLTGVFAAKQNSLTNIIDSVGGSFLLAEIIKINDTPYATLNDYLKSANK